MHVSLEEQEHRAASPSSHLLENPTVTRHFPSSPSSAAVPSNLFPIVPPHNKACAELPHLQPPQHRIANRDSSHFNGTLPTFGTLSPSRGPFKLTRTYLLPHLHTATYIVPTIIAILQPTEHHPACLPSKAFAQLNTTSRYLRLNTVAHIYSLWPLPYLHSKPRCLLLHRPSQLPLSLPLLRTRKQC